MCEESGKDQMVVGYGPAKVEASGMFVKSFREAPRSWIPDVLSASLFISTFSRLQTLADRWAGTRIHAVGRSQFFSINRKNGSTETGV